MCTYGQDTSAVCTRLFPPLQSAENQERFDDRFEPPLVAPPKAYPQGSTAPPRQRPPAPQDTTTRTPGRAARACARGRASRPSWLASRTSTHLTTPTQRV